jgi:hypothetical protein
VQAVISELVSERLFPVLRENTANLSTLTSRSSAASIFRTEIQSLISRIPYTAKQGKMSGQTGIEASLISDTRCPLVARFRTKHRGGNLVRLVP